MAIAAASLADRPRLRLVVLCMLYVAQGIPWGFTAVTLPLYLRASGVTPTDAGAVVAMTTLPYTFKWVWGPIIDRFVVPRFGRRRPWIVLGQLGMVASLGAFLVAGAPAQHLALMGQIVFVHTVFNALQDVAVDGLAVDQLTAAERGRVNGLMYASKWAGGALGGFALSQAIVHIGLAPAILAMMVVLLAIMVLPIVTRERATPVPPPPRFLALLANLARAFTLRSTLVCAVLMVLSNVASGVLVIASMDLYLGPLGWSMEGLSSLTGGVGLVVGGIAAASGGFIASRVGARRTIALATLLIAGGWLAFAALESSWGSYALALAFVVVEQIGVAIFTVALLTLCMDLSWPRVGASQFAGYMALSNVATTLGYKYGGAALDVWTHQGVYIAAACFQLALLALLPFIDPQQTRRELPVDDQS